METIILAEMGDFQRLLAGISSIGLEFFFPYPCLCGNNLIYLKVFGKSDMEEFNLYILSELTILDLFLI